MSTVAPGRVSPAVARHANHEVGTMLKTIGILPLAIVAMIWASGAAAIDVGHDCAEGTEDDETVKIYTPVPDIVPPSS
jgi:hypothetical protein